MSVASNTAGVGGRARVVATIVAVVLCIVAVVVWKAPASWLATSVAARTRGVLLLADARGTIWSGSAVLAVGSPTDAAVDAQTPSDDAAGPPPALGAGERLALPGRVTWTLDFERALAPVLHLTHDGVLLQPVAIRYRDGGLTVDPAAAALPAALLRLAGAPLNTLLPEGRCELRWNALRIGSDGRSTGDGTLSVADFSLALSPVRPLGSYLVRWSSAADGLTWTLATERGPLELQGGGAAGRRVQARVVARAAAGTPVPVVAQLDPLLDMLGRRGGAEAVLETGGARSPR